MLEVWTVFSDRKLTKEETAALWECLPSERQIRLRRQSALRQQSVLLAYGLLLALLRKQYGWRTLPEIAAADGGKPFFSAYPALSFSLSHTDNAAMAAISAAPVGVDIQRIRPTVPPTLGRLTGKAAAPSFFRSWVRWEARAKRNGGGLMELVRQDPPLEAGAVSSELTLFSDCVACVVGAEPLNVSSVRIPTLEELLADIL